jgi:hypothetical protein
MPDEGEEVLLLRGAFDRAADRVGAIADDEALAGFRARLHREHHRPDVRVVPGADIRRTSKTRASSPSRSSWRGFKDSRVAP